MLPTIFQFELNHWLRQPAIYVYALAFFLLTFLTFWGMGSETSGGGSVRLLTSPLMINSMLNTFSKFMLFLLPAIIGLSVYRDFRHHMHTLLYSYPFGKKSYLLGKFFAAYLVVVFIVSFMSLGIYAGTCMPGLLEERIGSFGPMAFLQSYACFVLPNLLLFGAIIFAVVTFSRNIYVGFLVVVLLLLVQYGINALLSHYQDGYLAALLDPMGETALQYNVRYWSIEEKNENALALGGLVIYNRLLWLVLALSICGWIYRRFDFHQFGFAGFKRKTSEEKAMEDKEGKPSYRDTISEAEYDFSGLQHLRAAWFLSDFNLRFILKSNLFRFILLLGFIFVCLQQAQINAPFGFKIMPTTWQMLRIPSYILIGITLLLTFLFAGMLIHRARISGMHQLVDINPMPNWVFLSANLIALTKLQMIMLSFILFGGLIMQTIQGYHHHELGLYLFQLFIINFVGLFIWSFAALFFQSLITNPYLGLFVLLLGAMGVVGMADVGIEHFVFRFCMGPDFNYSDMDGYGQSLPPFFLFKFYWLLFCGFLFLGTLCWHLRGLPDNFKHRFRLAIRQAKGKKGIGMLVFLTAFLTLGTSIYYVDVISNPKITSAKAEELWKVNAEKKYRQYIDLLQPRISSVKINMDIYPEQRNFDTKGEYLLVNNGKEAIDTLLVNYAYNELTDNHFDKKTIPINEDKHALMDLLLLEQPLMPGDSMRMYFNLKNEPNSFFHSTSRINYNGTFFTNGIFPGFGYRPYELRDNALRKKHGLPLRNHAKAHPADSLACQNSYAAKDADWIDFEAILSTSSDQIAIAPGYLQKEWEEKGRRYFHYKMDSKIKRFYGFNSGRYAVQKDEWKGISLEVYYHKDHPYNADRMMLGLKAALKYNSENFGPYQHRQARIIEFPVTLGRSATTFANSIPTSEIYFLADIDDNDPENIDLPFYVTAHELAHQWWGNQLIPADALGTKMLTESLAEYSAFKVLEKTYGKHKMRKFMRFNLDHYLRGRGRETKMERPLMLTQPGQEYIHYRKGALVFYMLSDYIGEEKFNAAIKSYLDEVRFQSAPYTTSLEMIDHLRTAIPDSMQYLVKDLFETITLYDNRLEHWESRPLPDGRYEVNLQFQVRKYRSDGWGKASCSDEEGQMLSEEEKGVKLQSLPLADYIEIGIFSSKDESEEAILHLEKHKISHIKNELTIIVDREPVEVAIDPYHKLIDADTQDNR